MDFADLSRCALLEMLVVLFQVGGVAGLCLSRLMPTSRWSSHGRSAFIVAMVGLGVAGALCGVHDSEFGLFAGGTMTTLLIGMTMGGGPADTTLPPGLLSGRDAGLVA